MLKDERRGAIQRAWSSICHVTVVLHYRVRDFITTNHDVIS
jgi:hypothetical protein